MAAKTTLKLSVPPQQLAALSFCADVGESFEQWLAELPMANVDEVAKRLYRAIVEVSQLQCTLDERFAMVELLRAPIHFTCIGLARRFLNQPVLVNETVRRFANQCQVLQNQLAVGYKVLVVQAIQGRIAFGPTVTEDEPGAIVPIAIYRAIGELTMTLLRSCQLYTDPNPTVWLELNQLLLLSERTNLVVMRLDEHADDETHGPFTIRNAYLRAALLATVSPNKLRQRQLSTLFEVLADWAKFAYLEPAAEDGNFIVELGRDEPPIYAPAFNEPLTELCRTIATDELVGRIEQAIEHYDDDDTLIGGRLYLANGISRELLAHAGGSWGRRTQRAFARLPSSGKLQICVGMSASHYHLAEGRDFESQLKKSQVFTDIARNRFMDRNDTYSPATGANDIWANAFDSGSRARMPQNPELDGGAIMAESRGEEVVTTPDNPLYPVHEANMVDTSPGGYCVRWADDPPGGLQTGELLAIRENGDQRWALAAVRWMRHVPNSGTLMGMQLVAPVAVPVGARLTNRKDADQQYVRALMLPALKVLRQPAMLILPRLPFQEGQRVLVNQSGSEVKAHLTKAVAQTDAFVQFEFRLLETAINEMTTPAKPGDTFDHLFKDPAD